MIGYIRLFGKTRGNTIFDLKIYTTLKLWCPLTPPMGDTDVYIDNDEFITSYLYEPEPIPESLLPPVFYAKRGDKRMKLDTASSAASSPVKKSQTTALASTTNLLPTAASIVPPVSVTTAPTPSSQTALKAAKMENIIMSRPLFDKPNTALIKLRRDIKMQRCKGWTNYKLDVIKSTLPIQPEINTFGDHSDYHWLPNDDFIVLHTLQVILELPLNLQVIAPAHCPNWDLVSDLVSSSYTHYYRSPSECKKRFESVILKREEMCLTEIQNKKQQQIQQQQLSQNAGSNVKGKQQVKPAPLNICKTKTLRTNQMFIQDNYKTLVHNTKRNFEKISQIAKQKHPPTFSYVPQAASTSPGLGNANLD